MILNRVAFFAAVRSPLFGGRLTESQVQGLDALLDAVPAGMPVPQRAYCLATAFHETGATMQPVTENLNYASAARIRAVWPSRFPTEASAKPFVRNPQGLANKVYGGRMGNVGVDDGWRYRGRGFSQLTGRDNYARAGRKLLADLERNPDLASSPKIAAQILYAGMAEGWFTGARLSSYFTPALSDPKNARKIVNGLDRAEDIARYYREFLAALHAAQAAPPPDIEPTTPAPVPSPQPATPGGLFADLLSLLKRIFA